MLGGCAADTVSMGLPEGQRYSIAFDRSDGWARLALLCLSTEPAALVPRTFHEIRLDTA
jgi:hypothetical protein